MIFQDYYFNINDLNYNHFGNRWNEKIHNSRFYVKPEERKYMSTCVHDRCRYIHTWKKKKKKKYNWCVCGGGRGSISPAEFMVLSMIQLKCHCTESNRIIAWLKCWHISTVEEKHQGYKLIDWNMPVAFSTGMVLITACSWARIKT